MDKMADLMNGLVRARSVRMNQEGWTIIKDFKFFRNLSFEQESKKKKRVSPYSFHLDDNWPFIE